MMVRRLKSNCKISERPEKSVLRYVMTLYFDISTRFEGETAIDLTDPEDFRMMAILRNTEV